MGGGGEVGSAVVEKRTPQDTVEQLPILTSSPFPGSIRRAFDLGAVVVPQHAAWVEAHNGYSPEYHLGIALGVDPNREILYLTPLVFRDSSGMFRCRSGVEIETSRIVTYTVLDGMQYARSAGNRNSS